MMRIKFAVLLLAFSCILNAQDLRKDKNYYLVAVGFWNVENLYDTINDPKKDDEEFLPQGKNAWTGERYRTKIDHLSDAISQMATDVTPDGLALIGLCEIENKSVLKDLVAAPKLKSRNYQIVHFDGPDARGVDPAFLYNPNYFKLTKALTYRLTLVTDSAHKTRDQLLVTGILGGDKVAVVVNHWPSRRGGDLTSRPNRVAAAKLCRHITDSVSKASPDTKIIIMGDLNDDPTDESVKTLRTYGEIKNAKDDEYFNAMETLSKQGIGTLPWEDNWNLFDQIIINHNLLPTDFKTFQYHNVRIFNKAFLKTDHGNWKGSPFHTYSGGTYTGGYSDHFPVFILLAKENNSKK